MPKLCPEITAWFDIPDDPMKGRVEIRHVKSGVVQRLLSENTETRTYLSEDGKRELRARQKMPPLFLLAMTAIVNWENHGDADGKPLDCTDENKRLFLDENLYLEFIEECREKVDELAVKEKQAAEKN